MSRVSVIIPAYNEADSIAATLRVLAPIRAQGHEVILADGRSSDQTAGIVRGHIDRLVSSERGRAKQMNAGAAAACGDIFLFLHADTRPPQGALDHVIVGLRETGLVWGRFDIRLSGGIRLLRVVETLSNLRSRWTGIATGDQALFVHRIAFEAVGGFAEVPLMEDIIISRRLKRLSRPLCLKERVVTSSRRWEENGIMRTILRMWVLRLAFALGVNPSLLARHYD
ncbi:MAG: TIGR04283 family arsenosugar biosynthesis glycosyltransferase [Gammaproteobacteria bacterium]